MALCALASCEKKEQPVPKEPMYGTVVFPISASFETARDIKYALAAIRIDPVMTGTRLRDRDRDMFLGYVKQICAVYQASSQEDIYISENADVWRLLKDNFPPAEKILAEAEKSGSTISLKSVFEKILRL